ncbi:hypothetical protein [Gordonia neofelifaecis]|uniref:Uncharacterized protein n=1 Tax=Gordonia neofelifaecis NRRL B-59395 TaxID=644548 RepID=F1YE12_9ACTN|nr:hypothetical protein [Gordonia neofelifaecis]EGD57102.1 hypothetical protein SCNU_01970 [Gordonia neofelifaecis NRRL B-59395]
MESGRKMCDDCGDRFRRRKAELAPRKKGSQWISLVPSGHPGSGQRS